MSWGAGTRAGQFLVLGAKARALLQGRAHVTVEDIHTLAYPSCATASCSTTAPRPRASASRTSSSGCSKPSSRRSADHELAPTPASHPRSPSGSLIDPQALMSIRNLELRARVVVEGILDGLHRSPYHGFSVEFTEYRQYTPGRRSALPGLAGVRPQRPLLHQEVRGRNQPALPPAGRSSRSMTYGSLGYTKAEYAATLAATLAYFLYLQGDAVGLLTFDEQVRDYLPARHRTGHLRHLMLALEKPAGGTRDRPGRAAEAHRRDRPQTRPDGAASPISWRRSNRWRRNLLALTACGHEVVVFQVLDPAEADFRFRTRRDVRGSGNRARRCSSIPAAARKEYLRKLEAHCAALRATLPAARHQPTHRLATDQPLELALFDFLRARMQRGARSRRRRHAGRSRHELPRPTLPARRAGGRRCRWSST